MQPPTESSFAKNLRFFFFGLSKSCSYCNTRGAWTLRTNLIHFEQGSVWKITSFYFLIIWLFFDTLVAGVHWVSHLHPGIGTTLSLSAKKFARFWIFFEDIYSSLVVRRGSAKGVLRSVIVGVPKRFSEFAQRTTLQASIKLQGFAPQGHVLYLASLIAHNHSLCLVARRCSDDENDPE